MGFGTTLGSSGTRTARNPFAPGGAMYGQNTTDAYNNGAMVGVPPGLTGWYNNNSYAAGGRNFGQPAAGTVVTAQNNNTQRQLNEAYANQLAARQQQPAAVAPNTNLLKQLLEGLKPSSGGGSAGGQIGAGMGAVSSGIDVGPVWDASQTAAGEAAIRSGAGTPPPQVAASGSSTVNRLYQDAMRSNLAADATEFARAAAYANAQQQLASQKARAQSGLSSAELLARLQAQQYQQQAFDNGLNNALLGGVLGSIF